MKKIRILFFTGNRAEFSFIQNAIASLDKKKFYSEILISGSHLDKKFGNTIEYIKKKLDEEKYKSIDKVYLIDNKRFLIQLQSNCHPFTYAKWYLYYSDGKYIIKNLPNITYFKFMTINQSFFVCLYDMFYILDHNIY